MEKIQYSKRARHVFILVVLFITLGVLISAGGEMTAQPSLPGPTPSGVAERLWYLDADISLGNELARLVVSRLNEKSWKQESHDLTSFAGQTIVIYFGSNNNGQGGVTGMYVDDVSLEVCVPN